MTAWHGVAVSLATAAQGDRAGTRGRRLAEAHASGRGAAEALWQQRSQGRVPGLVSRPGCAARQASRILETDDTSEF